MPRGARVTPGGLVYHALNRSVAGLHLVREARGTRGLRAESDVHRQKPALREEWQNRQAEDLGLWHTLCREGRPSKQTANQKN